MRLWLLVVLAGCRWNFDEIVPADPVPPPDAQTACAIEGELCTPAASCFTGACTDGKCGVDQPLDQVSCPAEGQCVVGVCIGSAAPPFVPSPVAANSNVGTGVASDGTRIIVGAGGANAAYILEETGGAWAVTATLTSSFGPANSLFGAAVAIEGDLAVVGSRYSRGPGMAPISGAGGAIVMYQRDTDNSWNEIGQLLGPDGGEFGGALAISNGRILVGAEYANVIAGGFGAAYIVEGAGASWSVVETLADVGADRLGHFVQLSKDRAFVGSLWDPGPTSSETGAVRIWERSTSWSLAHKLQPDDLRPDAFGQGFSVDGDRIAIGVPWFSNPDRGTGAVYVYTRDDQGQWHTPGPIEQPVLQRDANFGRGVVLREGRLFATSIDWNAGGAVTTNLYRLQPDGSWLLAAGRVDAGGGENGYGLGGIEVDLQMALRGDDVVVGYPVRGGSTGAVVIDNVSGL